MVEVVNQIKTGYGIKIPIFNASGDYMAVAIGARLYKTDLGKKSNIKFNYQKNLTSCDLDGKTVFEIRYEGSSATSTKAELYTPDGSLIIVFRSTYDLSKL